MSKQTTPKLSPAEQWPEQAHTLTLKNGKHLYRVAALDGGLLFLGTSDEVLASIREQAQDHVALGGRRTAIMEWVGKEPDGRWAVLGTIKYFSKMLSRPRRAFQ